MEWKPAIKTVAPVSGVSVKQKLSRGQGEILLPDDLSIERAQFALSLARTRVLALALASLDLDDRHRMLDRIATATVMLVETFIDHPCEDFAFTADIDVLADDERTSLAAKLGAAVTDLVMERLGFHWRANVREFRFKKARNRNEETRKIPDFVYDPGALHGFDIGSVVVTEAKGSLSRRKARRSAIASLARRAYAEQVRAFIDAKSDDMVVASGYAVAFGAVPGSMTSALAFASPQPIGTVAPSQVYASSLAAASVGGMRLQPSPAKQIEAAYTAEPRRPKSRSGGGGDGGGETPEGGRRAQPNGRLVFANYEAVFALSHAYQAAAFLRRLISGGPGSLVDGSDVVQRFVAIEAQDTYLIGMSADPPCEPMYPWVFAVDERLATRVLEVAAAAQPSDLPSRIAMTPVSTERRSARGYEAGVVVQGDGFALVDLSGRVFEHRGWHLTEGRWI